VVEQERSHAIATRRRPSHRVARLAFLMPNFTNLAFLEVVGVKKIIWLFFFNIWLFWRQFAYAIRLVSWLLRILLKSVIRVS